jgi:hypothetical protein
VGDWLVELQGDQQDLQMLGGQLAKGSVIIFHEGDRYFLRCADFASLGNSESVYQLAKEIIPKIQGIAATRLHRFVHIGPVGHVIDPAGNQHAFAEVNVVLQEVRLFAAAAIAGDSMPTVQPPLTDFEQDISVALGDTNVGIALRFMGNKENRWSNLYKVLDTIESDLGGEKHLETKGWVSKTKLKLFTNTANDYIALGEAARHGVLKKQSPPNPMSLAEAEELLGEVLQKWIESKR